MASVGSPRPIVDRPSRSELIAGGPEEAMPFKKTEYVRLADEMTGEIRVLREEQIVFPSDGDHPESDGGRYKTTVFHYVKIVDDATVSSARRGERPPWPDRIAREAEGQGRRRRLRTGRGRHRHGDAVQVLGVPASSSSSQRRRWRSHGALGRRSLLPEG